MISVHLLRASVAVGVGLCERASVFVCNDLQNNVRCDTVPGPAADEVCDEQDKDCDGRTEEGVLNACNQCGDVPEDV